MGHEVILGVGVHHGVTPTPHPGGHSIFNTTPSPVHLAGVHHVSSTPHPGHSIFDTPTPVVHGAPLPGAGAAVIHHGTPLPGHAVPHHGTPLTPLPGLAVVSHGTPTPLPAHAVVHHGSHGKLKAPAQTLELDNDQSQNLEFQFQLDSIGSIDQLESDNDQSQNLELEPSDQTKKGRKVLKKVKKTRLKDGKVIMFGDVSFRNMKAEKQRKTLESSDNDQSQNLKLQPSLQSQNLELDIHTLILPWHRSV